MPQIERLIEGLLGLLERVDLAEGELGRRLEEAVHGAATLLEADGAGLMLMDPDGRLKIAGASNPEAAALERAQLEIGDGPGIESTRRRTAVSVADVKDDPRWPALAAALGDSGVCAVLSAPIWLGGRPAGNLNLLSRSPRAWSDSDRQALSAYAGVITAFLRIAGRERPSTEPSPRAPY
jgi:GAF domain-containing protein